MTRPKQAASKAGRRKAAKRPAAARTDNLFLRGELGFVAGGAAAMVFMAWQLVKQIRVGLTDESLAHLVEQIEHEPLEI